MPATVSCQGRGLGWTEVSARGAKGLPSHPAKPLAEPVYLVARKGHLIQGSNSQVKGITWRFTAYA